MMDLRGLLGLVAAAGQLYLAVLVASALRAPAGDSPRRVGPPRPFLHGPGRATARPLVCLCLCVFVWDFSEFAEAFFRDPAWHLVALAGACLAPAFLFHAVVRYVGAVERFWFWRSLLYALCVTLAALSLSGLALPPVRQVVEGTPWEPLCQALFLPFTVRALLLLRSALRDAREPLERTRCQYVLAAILLSIAGRGLELGAGPAAPIGNLGSVLAVLLLGYAILRHRLLEIEVAFSRACLILLMCVGATFSYFAGFRVLPRELDLELFATLVVTVFLFFAFRFVLQSWHAEAERTRRLALLGELAAVVAHEVRNPLSSIKGALQFVEEEQRAALRAAAETATGADAGAAAAADARARKLRDFFAIMFEEIERLAGLVDDLQRLARPMEAQRRPVALNDLVLRTLALLSEGLLRGTAIRQELDPALATVHADPELLRQALINLVKNAVEAQPGGGEIRVATRARGGPPAAEVELEVADRGPGIADEDLPRLQEPFFTTKRGGSGLGLAIVKRVADAHQGRLEVFSRPGEGSRFLLRLPVGSPPAASSDSSEAPVSSGGAHALDPARR
ncbi:MAG: hypothetical protein HYZ53_16470 [Planctomycetes bacterium]|nr:hypothetical protein [Planctomycetota bacterium]